MNALSTINMADVQVVSNKRGCLFTIGQSFKWFVIVVAVLVLAGVVYPMIATEQDKRTYRRVVRCTS